MVQTAHLNGGDIVPISDVQEVVTKTLDQKEERKNAYSKLNGAHNEFKRLAFRVKKWIAIVPTCVVLIFCILLAVVAFYTVIKANWIYSAIYLKQSSYVDTTVPMAFSVFDVKGNATDYCEVIFVRNKYQGRPAVSVDIYTFNEPVDNVIYSRTNRAHRNQIYMPWGGEYKYNKSSIQKYEFFMTTFCYRPANLHGKADLLVYVFQRQPSYSSYMYTISTNTRYCNDTKVNQGFRFVNDGPSGIFLNVSTKVRVLKYRQQLVARSCLNSSECKVQKPPKLIVIPKKFDSDKNPITVACVYSVSKTLFSFVVLLYLLGLSALSWALQKFYQTKCVPLLREWYFQREIVRESLGETAINMLDEAIDFGELFTEVEKENKKYAFVLKETF